jgi:hypothetical protein
MCLSFLTNLFKKVFCCFYQDGNTVTYHVDTIYYHYYDGFVNGTFDL